MIKKHNHSYNGCEHNLQFCGHCDVVYCSKCNKEWYANNSGYSPFWKEKETKPWPYLEPYKYYAVNSNLEVHKHNES